MVDFRNVSLRGRIAYGTMCVESYALAHYPERDWRPVLEVLWYLSKDVYWDDWPSRGVDILPECGSHVIPYDSDDFETLDERSYETLCNLYEDMPVAWATIMSDIVGMEREYAYTVIPGFGLASIAMLEEIVSLLEAEGIEVPDAMPIESLRFEGDGRGDPYDARPLSRILKRLAQP